MCFYIDEKHPDKKIAKKDIVCYKILWEDYKSLYQSKLYKFNKSYKVKIGKPYQIAHTKQIIDKGFHSYSSLKKVIHERVSIINILNYTTFSIHYTLSQFIIVKYIIPKGSEYYYNSVNKEYVSNQIIIKERIK